MIHFHIAHTTSYLYDNDVYDLRTLIKTYPIEDERQKVLSHLLSVTGNPEIIINKDAFGNKFSVFKIRGPVRELIIKSTFDIETVHKDVLTEVSSKCYYTWDDVALIAMDRSFQVFLNQMDYSVSSEISYLVYSFNPMFKNPLDVVLEFNYYVNTNFRYDTTATDVFTPLSQVWYKKAGVCQDFSHVLIAMLRMVNIPARYVSGYICPNNNGMRGDGATHAWVEAYLPNYGWLGLDPTNNCLAEEKHVRVAFGRDYEDVSPIKGDFKGIAYNSMSVVVDIGYY